MKIEALQIKATDEGCTVEILAQQNGWKVDFPGHELEITLIDAHIFRIELNSGDTPTGMIEMWLPSSVLALAQSWLDSITDSRTKTLHIPVNGDSPT